MSNARKKRRIAGLISKGLLDPDWRNRYMIAAKVHRKSGPGFFRGLWLSILALIGRVPQKPEFRSQRPKKNVKPRWSDLGQKA